MGTNFNKWLFLEYVVILYELITCSGNVRSDYMRIHNLFFYALSGSRKVPALSYIASSSSAQRLSPGALRVHSLLCRSIVWLFSCRYGYIAVVSRCAGWYLPSYACITYMLTYVASIIACMSQFSLASSLLGYLACTYILLGTRPGHGGPLRYTKGKPWSCRLPEVVFIASDWMWRSIAFEAPSCS